MWGLQADESKYRNQKKIKRNFQEMVEISNGNEAVGGDVLKWTKVWQSNVFLVNLTW